MVRQVYEKESSDLLVLNLGSGVTYQASDTHGYPEGGVLVFRKDPGQLESRLVSVQCMINWFFVKSGPIAEIIKLLLIYFGYSNWEVGCANIHVAFTKSIEFQYQSSVWNVNYNITYANTNNLILKQLKHFQTLTLK